MNALDRAAVARQHRVTLISAFALALLPCAFACWQWPSLASWVATHRALGYAREALAALDAANRAEAIPAVAAAYRLAPAEPAVLRAAGRIALSLNSPQAVYFLTELWRMDAATRSDQCDLALALHRSGNHEGAEAAFRKLLGEAPRDPLILEAAFDHFVSIENHREAIQTGEMLLRLQPAAARHRIRLAALHVDHGNREERSLALDYLLLAAREPSADGVLAIELLLSKETLAPEVREDLVPLIFANPSATEWQALRAHGLRLELHPWERDAVLEEVFEARRGWPAARLALAAAWLTSIGEFEFLLEKIPRETALGHPTLLAAHLSALAENGSWDEIEGILTRSRLNISEPTLLLYRALAAHRGRDAPDEARIEIRRAVDAMRRTGNRGDCFAVAREAEEMGCLDVAESAFEIAVESEDPRLCSEAFAGLLRLARSSGDARAMREVLRRYGARFPYRSDLSEQLLHLDLLLGLRVEDSLRAALRLAAEEPGRAAPRVIAALAYLRMHDHDSAAAMLEGIDESTALTPGQTAVLAAVGASARDTETARNLAARIDAADLLAEERKLIASF